MARETDYQVEKRRRKAELIKIAQENTELFKNQQGYIKDGKRISFYNELLNTKQGSKCYNADDVLRIADSYKPVQKYNTQVIVPRSDSLTTAREIKYNNPNAKVLVLNFASYNHPGGMYLDGSTAQEECLCRQSTLYPYLVVQKEFYSRNAKQMRGGLYGNDMIITPSVKVFRDKDYKFLSDIVEVGVITSAAVNKYGIIRYRRNLLDKCGPAMLERMDCILGLAEFNGFTHLVLGAYGCGVFKNDTTEVAKMWKFLTDTKYKGAFEMVAHPIPDEKNWKKFYDVFS